MQIIQNNNTNDRHGHIVGRAFHVARPIRPSTSVYFQSLTAVALGKVDFVRISACIAEDKPMLSVLASVSLIRKEQIQAGF